VADWELSKHLFILSVNTHLFCSSSCILLCLLIGSEVLFPGLSKVIESFLELANIEVEDGTVKVHFFKLENVLSVIPVVRD